MKELKFLIFMSLALIVATFSLGIGQGRAQQAPDENSSVSQTQGKPTTLQESQDAAAAARRYYGFPRSTTNAERRAAAERNAARRAGAVAPTAEGGTK